MHARLSHLATAYEISMDTQFLPADALEFDVSARARADTHWLTRWKASLHCPSRFVRALA